MDWENVGIFALSGVAVTATALLGSFYRQRYAYSFWFVRKSPPTFFLLLIVLLLYFSQVLAVGSAVLNGSPTLCGLHVGNLFLFVAWCHLFFCSRAPRVALAILTINLVLLGCLFYFTQSLVLLLCLVLYTLWILFLVLVTMVSTVAGKKQIVQRPPV